MKYHHPLEDLLGSRSKVSLLRLLIKTRAEQTGSEMARQVGLDVKTCHISLQDLATQGVVQCRRAGAAILYKVNARHYLVEEMLGPLFAREEESIVSYGRDLLGRIKRPVSSLILFGSVARKHERPTSDVDLILIVASPAHKAGAEDDVDQAAGDLVVRYGNPPQVIVLDREEFRRRAAKGESLVSEVLRTGHVVKGPPLSKLLARDS